MTVLGELALQWKDLALLSLPKLYGVKIYNYVNVSKAKILESKLENKLRDAKGKNRPRIVWRSTSLKKSEKEKKSNKNAELFSGASGFFSK